MQRTRPRRVLTIVAAGGGVGSPSVPDSKALGLTCAAPGLSVVMPYAVCHGRQVTVMKDLPSDMAEMYILQES